MIITKKSPFTLQEIQKVKKEYGEYVKTVIDVKNIICSAGANMHYESEKILLETGSNQSDIWGGGVDLATKIIDFNSFINIRPKDGNSSNEILDPEIREEFKKTSEDFFKKVL